MFSARCARLLVPGIASTWVPCARVQAPSRQVPAASAVANGALTRTGHERADPGVVAAVATQGADLERWQQSGQLQVAAVHVRYGPSRYGHSVPRSGPGASQAGVLLDRAVHLELATAK